MKVVEFVVQHTFTKRKSHGGYVDFLNGARSSVIEVYREQCSGSKQLLNY